jgi:hypothetical protein
MHSNRLKNAVVKINKINICWKISVGKKAPAEKMKKICRDEVDWSIFCKIVGVIFTFKITVYIKINK